MSLSENRGKICRLIVKKKRCEIELGRLSEVISQLRSPVILGGNDAVAGAGGRSYWACDAREGFEFQAGQEGLFEKLKEVNTDQSSMIFNTRDIFSGISGKIKNLNENVFEVSKKVNEIRELNANIVDSIDEISKDSEATNDIVIKTTLMTEKNNLDTKEAFKYTEELNKSAKELEKYFRY